MPLIARTIPNLVQGISQQPEILRLNSQATSQENGFSSVVEGLKKRPNTSYVAKLTGSSLANAYIHTIREFQRLIDKSFENHPEILLMQILFVLLLLHQFHNPKKIL